DLYGRERLAPEVAHVGERRVHGVAIAVALDERLGFGEAAGLPEEEDDLGRLARLQLQRHLERRAGGEPGAEPAVERLALLQRERALRAAAPAKKRRAVRRRGDRGSLGARAERGGEGDALGEGGVEPVGGEERVGVGRGLDDGVEGALP